MGNKKFIKETIALGKLPYVDKVQLRGRSTAMSTGAETVWGPASSTYAQLLVGTALEVLSSSANDTAAGTGARTVQVDWLDANYVAGSEIITLSGVTPVPLVKTTVIAINSVKILTAGSGLTNAGTIDTRTVAGSTVKSRIDTSTGTTGRSTDFIYTVPDNFIALLGDIHFSATAAIGDLTVYLISKDSSGMQVSEGMAKSAFSNTGFNIGQGCINFGSGLLIPEKTLIELRAISSAGAAVDLVAQAELLLFDVKNNGLF